MKKERKN